MISIASVFKDVLLKEDNITVPGLGTLETSYQSAQLDEKSGVIHPPTKLVTLNTAKTDDADNKLIKFIVDDLNISEDAAKTAVADFVREVKNKVATKATVTLDEVGILYQAENGETALKSVPSKLSIDNYGMDSVEVEPVAAADRVATVTTETTAATSRGKTVGKGDKKVAAATSKVTTTKTTTTKTTTTKTEKEEKKKSKFPWLLAILLPLLAILTVLFFIFKDSIFGDKDKPSTEVVQQDTPADPLAGNTTDTNTELVDATNNEPERPTIDSDLEILAQAGFSNVSPQNLGEKYDKYYLIGGSFTDKVNARERKRAIKAKDILNVEGSSLYRVVIANSNSAQEIVEEYNKALKRGINADDIWLLKNSK